MRLRVLTLNVWALPLGVSRDNAVRLTAIGERLAELDADVVALQEVWTLEARQSLVAAGEQAGYRYVWHNQETRGGSGLVLLSRLEIVETSFASFLVRGKPERLDHSDYYGGKGFALVRVQTESGPITILNTHLHARYSASAQDDDYLEVRAAQAVQLSATLQMVAEPLIALGDFNLQEGETEYRILQGLTGWVDLAADLGVPQPTVGKANPYSQGSNSRIDYVFARNGAERALRGITVRRVLDEPLEINGRSAAYSDHFGVMADIEVQDTPSPRHSADSAALRLARKSLARGRELTSRRERSQQLGAVGVAVASATLWTSAPSWTRREWLRTFLRAGALAGITASAGVGWLGLASTPEQLRAFRTVERQLAAFGADERDGG